MYFIFCICVDFVYVSGCFIMWSIIWKSFSCCSFGIYLLVNTILGEQSKENNKHSNTTFELPKEYERFDGLGVPVGLTLNCNSEKSIYGGGNCNVKEIDSRGINILTIKSKDKTLTKKFILN